MMDGRQAVEYIHSINWRGSRLGLERTHDLLERMGRPQDRLKFVHIAGTNGKGSTAAMIASALVSAGYRAGLYTSPYIERFNERIQLNGQPISDASLGECTEFTRAHAEAMDDHPTEFELVTAVALEYFAKSGCDAVVLEVGLGGRLDSTNAIDSPECAVITAIDFDHTDILGDTVEQIACEKAGIIKPGCDVVLYSPQQGVKSVVETVCSSQDAKLHIEDFSALVPADYGLWGQRFSWMGHEYTLPLLGGHQLRNAAVALRTLDVLRGKGWSISLCAEREGLSRVKWPGRFEVLCERPAFIVDGGHNPQGARSAAQTLSQYFPGKGVTFLAGVLRDKDYPSMFAAIAPLADRFVAVEPDNPRALPATELAEFLGRFGKPVAVAKTVSDGVDTAIGLAGKNGIVCALGSLYMVGSIRRRFMCD